MKSRVSASEKRAFTNSKLSPTKSSSEVQISNRSATNLFLSKNLSALHIYSNLFGNKDPVSHIGDANTHFKKTLRKYNEFSGLKNTKWIQQRIQHRPKLTRAEHKRAAGDQVSASKKKKDRDKANMAAAAPEEPEEQVAGGEEAGEAEQDDLGRVDTDNPDAELDRISDDKVVEVPQSDEEEPPPIDDIQKIVQDVNDEMEMAEEGEDFQKWLEKSVDEMEQAVKQAKSEENKEKEVKVDDLESKEGDGSVVPKGEGDSAMVFPQVDNKVLKELDEAEAKAISTANIINELKERIAVLLGKDHMSEQEGQELENINKQLIKHMAEFEDKTRLIQMLVQVADQHLKPMPARVPPVQAPLPEDILPKVIMCGAGSDNHMPRILVCEPPRRPRRRSSEPSRQRASALPPSLPSPHPPPPPFVQRLSESYEMQEKLAQDNVDLEDKRWRLQEELLKKDRCVEGLQRRVCSLQAEMRIVVKENQALNEKLERMEGGTGAGAGGGGRCRSGPDMPCGSGKGLCPADVENRLQHYSQTTTALEKQVEGMEEEVRRMQDELVQVKRERAEMERQRAARSSTASQPPQPPQPQQYGLGGGAADGSLPACRAGCGGPCHGVAGPTPNMAEQQLRELREQYNRLQDDYKGKLTEVASLRADNEMMRRTAGEAERLKKECERRLAKLEEEAKRKRSEHDRLLGSKEQLVEQEQQLSVAKQRFREAQDELDELRACVQEQAAQLEDYRCKYLAAQQQVEEQRRQLDLMEMENQRISEQINCEIQRVKGQFQERLAELAPLPDILKATQLKLQEEQHVRSLAERNVDACRRELQMYKDKLACMAAQQERALADRALGEEERASLEGRAASLECRCGELQLECERARAEVSRAEERQADADKRLEEKMHEVAQLSAQLEAVREESARQVTRTKERCETVRRALQGQVAELERQLAQSRAAARAALKDRDDIRHKMQAQINNLIDNFEEGQLRIRSLQGHINYLKTSYTSMFGAAEAPGCGGGSPQPPPPRTDDEDGPCNCGGAFG